MTDYRQELSIIRQALLRASDRLHRIQYEGLAVQIKPDGSPVTNGDLEVNRIVQEALFAVYPDDGWLSEESPDNPVRLKKKPCMDPGSH